jgi:hypothetical protein
MADERTEKLLRELADLRDRLAAVRPPVLVRRRGAR